MFVLVNAAALLSLKRRWAPLPLLIGALYLPRASGIEVGPFHFPVIRLLIAVGVFRVIIKGEWRTVKLNVLDWLMMAWGLWALTSSAFHGDPNEALVFRLGIVYNIWGAYFLIRVLCQSMEDLAVICRVTAILLVPVALEMCLEQLRGHNLFAKLGPGVMDVPQIRKGRIRAQGPFAHSILAGTVGAVCLPLTIAIWERHRKTAVAGIVACALIILASASSGPILSGVAGVGALMMWRYRSQMRVVRWLGVITYVALDVIMKDPAYFIMARIDLAGGSTGWHRAALIRSAFNHLSEWWLAGTDYTRHWMTSGVTWSAEQSDITNYYLKMGVWGGLPLMLLFIAILTKGFSFVGRSVKQLDEQQSSNNFIIWCFGAALFSHAVTSLGVSYFDQSFLFMYLTLGVIGSTRSAEIVPRAREITSSRWDEATGSSGRNF